MRTKLIYLGAALAVLLSVVVFAAADSANGKAARYHQHLEQPSETELAPCAVCGGEAALCTHLPIIRIDTGSQTIPGNAIVVENSIVGAATGPNGETEILTTLSTVEGDGVWHHADDQADLTAQALFHIRGNSSRAFSKHSYRVKLVENDDATKGRDLPLMGMTANSDWVLHGPFLDKTLIRNYMWMNLSAEIMGYAPNVRFCELILDGEYQGVYVLMETISMDDGRVELTKYEPGDPVCSYILQMGSHRDPERTIENYTFYTYQMELGRQIEVVYPGALYQTEQVKNYINTDFSEIERLLFSGDMLNEPGTYTQYIDVDSFVDYYVIQEFLGVNDAFANSTFFHRDVRGKLHAGPVWDYNNALDNFMKKMPADEFILSQRGWYARLMTDEDFVDQVVDRYRQLRKGILSDEKLCQYIDETVAWLGSAVERNYKVWGYSFDYTQLSPLERRSPSFGQQYTNTERERLLRELNPASFQEALDMMEDYMLYRGKWLDHHIDSLYQYGQRSKNAAWILE